MYEYRASASPMGGDMTPEDRAYVDQSIATLEGIKKAADGRPLTRSQQADWDANLEVARAILGKYSAQDHNTYAGVKLRRFLETGDPVDGREGFDGIRRQQLAAAAAVIRGERSRTEGSYSSGSETTIRELFRQARDHGASSLDSSFSPEYLESRALQSQGGSAIPTTFVDRVAVYARQMSPMLDPDVVRLIDRPDGSPLTAPRWTADQASGGTVTAEAAGITELDGTISAAALTFHKFGIMSKYSAELAEDNVIGLEDLIARGAARELSIDIGALLTTGSGTGQPGGFITLGTNGGTATGTAGNTSLDTFFGPADLIDLMHQVPSSIRTTGVFQASTTAMAKIRKFRDSNKQFIYQPAIAAGMPDTLFGRPIYENPAMDAVASASKSVAFGDFSQYYVARTPLRVDVSKEYAYGTDQLALRVLWRVAGTLVDTTAVKYLVSSNT